MKKQFDGFGEEAISFLRDLAANNNKEWFDANRARYEDAIKKKSHALIEVMAERFATEGLPLISDRKLSMFRINRDIRFSHNKEPYKTNLGIIFPYSPHPIAAGRLALPGLYFHIEPESTFIAGGLYAPDPPLLLKIRKYIEQNWEELDAIVNDPELKKNFHLVLKDDSLKRVPKGFDQNHPASGYLKLKGFTLYSQFFFHQALSPDLPDFLVVKALQMLTFLEFFYNSSTK